MAQAVSPEVLEQWKERWECWNRGDLDEMQAMYAEDAVFDISAVFTDTAPMRGHASMRRHWEELYESMDGLRIEPFEVFALGSGRYVAHVRMYGKGKRSGAEVDQRFAFLYTIREQDEKVLRSQLFPDLASALASIEEPASAR
ncbi:MAG: nuclear transport factor 2 family protein [Solirubrobacterales bacterium]